MRREELFRKVSERIFESALRMKVLPGERRARILRGGLFFAFKATQLQKHARVLKNRFVSLSHAALLQETQNFTSTPEKGVNGYRWICFIVFPLFLCFIHLRCCILGGEYENLFL